MTRLSILHTESSCGWGGQELRIITEAEGFRLHGHGVTIGANKDSRILVEATRRGIPVLPLPIRRKGLSGFLAVRAALRRGGWDIVNTHSSTDSWLAALASASLPRRSRVPLVRTRHISAPISSSAANRWLYGVATSHVVTTGESLRVQVVSEAGIPEERVTSVPTGIDLKRFMPGDRIGRRHSLGLPRDGFVIGIVATLRSWKGHRYLVDAVARMAGPPPLLVIVGDGPGRDNLVAQVRSLGLQDRVRLAGQQDDVTPWLQSFDLFVLPSYANEGIPQAIMQAMACGCPVLSTPVGAIPEIIEHGTTGYMVAPRDVEALADALAMLRTDAELRQRLALGGMRLAEKRFSADAMYLAMQSIFLQALSASHCGTTAVRA